LLIGLASLVGVASSNAVEPPSPVLSDAEIRKILVDRIDVQQRGVGIVVGVISPEGRRVVPYGKLAKDDARPLTGDTLFEVGSVTKVITSLLLADMVQRGEVALTDPVAKYLPAGVKVPERNGKSITLVDLATHTSGLPFWPTNFPPTEDLTAPSKYTEEQLFQFLSSYELPPREIGSAWEYSNIGVGLLGRALARRAGKSYETLVRERITAPLRLDSTAITLSREMRSRLAIGHDLQGEPMPYFDVPVSPASGAFASSANDLLSFLAACMGLERSPLSGAMDAMLATRRPNQLWFIDQALGWFVIGKGDEQVVLSGGATIGFGCTVLYDPRQRIGVVVLTNARGSEDGIALHVLRPSKNPLPKPKPAVQSHKAIPVDPKLFDRYAGKYQPSPGMVITVVRDGDALRIALPAAPTLRLFPETERDYFVKGDDDIRVTFKTDEQGNTTSLIVYLGKLPIPATRMPQEVRAK
jgi:CubicO group peptidase (beta-lactamase class C family)